MQTVFEKIIEKLEEQKAKGIYDSNSIIGEKNTWAKAIEIVKQEASTCELSNEGRSDKNVRNKVQ